MWCHLWCTFNPFLPKFTLYLLEHIWSKSNFLCSVVFESMYESLTVTIEMKASLLAGALCLTIYIFQNVNWTKLGILSSFKLAKYTLDRECKA